MKKQKSLDFCRVLAIDMGYRNLAYCVVDNLSWREPVAWDKDDLWIPDGKKRNA